MYLIRIHCRKVVIISHTFACTQPNCDNNYTGFVHDGFIFITVFYRRYIHVLLKKRFVRYLDFFLSNITGQAKPNNEVHGNRIYMYTKEEGFSVL